MNDSSAVTTTINASNSAPKKLIDYSTTRATTKVLPDYSRTRASDDLESALLATRRVSSSSSSSSRPGVTMSKSMTMNLNPRRATGVSSSPTQAPSRRSARRRASTGLDMLAKTAMDSSATFNFSPASNSSNKPRRRSSLTGSSTNSRRPPVPGLPKREKRHSGSKQGDEEPTAKLPQLPVFHNSLSTLDFDSTNHAHPQYHDSSMGTSSHALTLNCTAHSHTKPEEEEAVALKAPVSPTNGGMGPRRNKMTWLANNARKRDLKKQSKALPTLLKVVYPKGKEPKESSGNAPALEEIPEDASKCLAAPHCCSRSLQEDPAATGEPTGCLPPRSKSLEETQLRKQHCLDASLSVRTLSGQKPKVATSSRRRSTTSFVAGSQIRTYNVVC